METPLLALLALSGLSVLYGSIKFALLAYRYKQQRDAFDHRAEGRKAERRDDRRVKLRRAAYLGA